MILIKNKQRKIKINESKLKSSIQQMLDFVDYKGFDIGIWFTTNKTIQKYNRIYRKKDKATDILSFPYHEKLKSGERIIVNEEEDKNLGDIIISLEFAMKDAELNDRSINDHVLILLSHGIAHLLGYDHKSESDYQEMKIFEKKLLKTC